MGKTVVRIRALGGMALKIYLIMAALMFVGGIIAGAVLTVSG